MIYSAIGYLFLISSMMFKSSGYPRIAFFLLLMSLGAFIEAVFDRFVDKDRK